MMEFGKSLKSAREAKSLTISQMVEMTHLAPSTISELENEDFSHIAAPIYGRGFVKLYCEAVGLDPKPFVAEFMEIFSGNHDTAIRERPVVNPEPEEQAAEPEVPQDDDEEQTNEPEKADTSAEPPVPTDPVPPKPVYTTDSLFGSDPRFAPEPTSAPKSVSTPEPVTASEPPVQSPIPQPPSPDTNDHAFSRYAAPIRQWKPVIPTSAWRIGVLSLAALVLLTLLVLGIRTLYRATNPQPEVPEQPTTRVETAKPQAEKPKKPTTEPAKPKTTPTKAATAAANPKAVKTERKPQTIPALYVD